jgi:hypothetical protein
MPKTDLKNGKTSLKYMKIKWSFQISFGSLFANIFKNLLRNWIIFKRYWKRGLPKILLTFLSE